MLGAVAAFGEKGVAEVALSRFDTPSRATQRDNAVCHQCHAEQLRSEASKHDMNGKAVCTT